MTEIKPDDYKKTKAEYQEIIKQMARASIKDSFKSLVFVNNSLNLGLQAFGVDVAKEVALTMKEEIDKLIKATDKEEVADESQITMEFYPKTGESNEERSTTSNFTGGN